MCSKMKEKKSSDTKKKGNSLRTCVAFSILALFFLLYTVLLKTSTTSFNEFARLHLTKRKIVVNSTGKEYNKQYSKKEMQNRLNHS